MILILHIFIALSSIIYTGYVSFFPSKKKLFFSYGLVGLTIASGTYLIITKPAHMIATCFEGLIYIGIISLALFFAQRKVTTS